MNGGRIAGTSTNVFQTNVWSPSESARVPSAPETSAPVIGSQSPKARTARPLPSTPTTDSSEYSG